jgi:hypothetical protein
MSIVIAIMGILGVIGARTFLEERDRYQFNDALIKTMQLIKTVRTFATTSYPIYVDSPEYDFVGNVIPLKGYGIKAELDKKTGQFTLTTFANVDTGVGTGIERFQNDDFPSELDKNDIILGTYTLPNQIAFKYFYFDGPPPKWKEKTDKEPAGPNAFEATVVFSPPMGNMTITGKNEDGSTVDMNELTLQFENRSSDAAGPKKCQQIIINKVKMFPELAYESKC